MHLVTTALEETWPKSGSVLFLGEWCKKFDRENVWKVLDHQTLPYHWDDREKLYQDYLYLHDLQERVLAKLTQELNGFHGVNYSLRHWRILLGPWLGAFLHISFDRWTNVQKALSSHTLTSTTVLPELESDFIPNDMGDFNKFISSDEWNHVIYNHVLRYLSSIPLETKSSQIVAKAPASKAIAKQSLGQKFLNFYSRIAKKLCKSNDAFFINTYLPFRQEAWINFKLWQIPQIWNFVHAVRVGIDKSKRQKILQLDATNDFEKFFSTIVYQQIPKVYFEGYQALVSQTKMQGWPQNPKFIFTSNSHISHDVFKAWAALKVEKGSRFAVGQHGGLYGMGKWSFNETHEKEISDAFLTWGWKDSGNVKVKPIGKLKFNHPLNSNHAKEQNLLLVTNTTPRYSRALFSIMIGRQWLDYFEDECQFVESLTPSIQNVLKIRMYPQDYGWSHASRLKNRFPNVFIDDGKKKMGEILKHSRIYVSTYNATTFLESISMDIPTVIYWNPKHWELRSEAAQYFEKLKGVGIFHDSPRSAANHINQVWEDVDSWWKSREVRETLVEFKNNYCLEPTDLLSRLERLFKSLS